MGERPTNFLSRKLVREIKTPETRRVDGFRVSGLRRLVSIEFKGASPQIRLSSFAWQKRGHGNPRAKILKIFLLLESPRLTQVHDS
jgi:hypothetical protein